jgi:Na+/H+-dicarboxylate symporter
MSFSKKILLGLIFGVAVGLFFGERIAFLGIVADGYVKFLQVTVLPYIMVSLIAGLGSLSSKEARILGMKVGVVVVLLWLVGLALAFLFPLAFPELKAATFFSTTIIQKPEPFDFLALYIPANPFHSLANNVVPAVVLFSMIMGIALIGIPEAIPLATQTMSGSTPKCSIANIFPVRPMPDCTSSTISSMPCCLAMRDNPWMNAGGGIT